MLLEQHISEEPTAKVLLLFGGNPFRRDEVIRALQFIPRLTIIGTLSEKEGIDALNHLPKVDIVLIGGRYSIEQRNRIKTYIQTYYPDTIITEPGIDYPYDDYLIKQNVEELI